MAFLNCISGNKVNWEVCLQRRLISTPSLGHEAIIMIAFLIDLWYSIMNLKIVWRIWFNELKMMKSNQILGLKKRRFWQFYFSFMRRLIFIQIWKLPWLAKGKEVVWWEINSLQKSNTAKRVLGSQIGLVFITNGRNLMKHLLENLLNGPYFSFCSNLLL